MHFVRVGRAFGALGYRFFGAQSWIEDLGLGAVCSVLLRWFWCLQTGALGFAEFRLLGVCGF